MSRNKEVVRQYYEEAFNEGQTDLLEELIAEDVVNHDPVSDERLTPEEARGFEPTSNRVSGSNMILMRLENGKIAERWEESDTLEFLQQLGIDVSFEESAQKAA